MEVFEEVFQFVLKIASEKKLVSGKTAAGHVIGMREQCHSLGLRTYIPEPKRNTEWA